MSGKWAKLQKPLAIMSKEKDETTTSYRMVGVVRQKLVFKASPSPITRPLTPMTSNKRARGSET